MPLEPCVYNVPMALDPQTSRTHGLEPLLAMARCNALIQDARRYTLGPMPVATFLDTFMSTSSMDRSHFLSPQNAFRAVPERASSAAEVCEPLFQALSKSTKHKSRCPGFVFDKTSERSTRPSRLGYAKPHICCFTPDNLKHVERSDPASRSELGYAELIVQVTGDPFLDYFVDPDAGADDETLAAHDFDREVAGDGGQQKEVMRAFGLHVSLATEILARQQRLFLFTISLSGSFARLFRWDRSGCIVSRAFDIRKHPNLLAEFLWRFSKLTDAERGFDLTVRTASPQEEELFRNVVQDYIRDQADASNEELEKTVSTHYQPGHVAVLPIRPQGTSGPEEPTRYFLVSRPVVSPLSLDGRCTRGYWGVDLATRRPCFLKDTWRTYAQKGSEGETLQKLNKLGVRNVPLLAVHGDVRSMEAADDQFQDTQSDQFVDESWARRIGGKDVIVHRRRHYRMVTHTVGFGLKDLRGTEELLHATYDAFVAMQDALAKDRRIHRDLSVGNIILVKEPDRTVRRGYLIDWDASTHVDKEGEALHEGRAGTWSFMSIRMLAYGHEDYKHTFKDDMESLLYVVLYCALLYLPHRFVSRNLTALHTGFFEECQDAGSTMYGGVGKTANSANRHWTQCVRFGSPALQEWLDTVMNYHRPPNEEYEKYRGMWEPEKLDAFWSNFLETHELERDDRTVHKISMVSYYDPNSPPTAPPTPLASSSSLPLPYNDLPTSSSSSDEGPDHKRARLAYAQFIRSHPRARGSHAAPTESTPLRRSLRIRDQQNQPKPPPASRPANRDSTRKRSATSGRSRGQGRGRGRGRSHK
ncbi:hypothetical protein GY45DRAFT_450849 [Cubamyces sp. BRFM 1775]|nr:hypothetical protein GY45DRAFT_450849 [Cubamyces sp. BRFM 1775]